jgi:hypothetical protein
MNRAHDSDNGAIGQTPDLNQDATASAPNWDGGAFASGHAAAELLASGAVSAGFAPPPAASVTGPPAVFASLSNARHPPLGPLGGGVLGYVGDASDGRGVYASLTVAPTGLLGVFDRWVVARVDLQTRDVAESVLHPQPAALGAEMCSLAGFGIA